MSTLEFIGANLYLLGNSVDVLVEPVNGVSLLQFELW
jgi:hypothetical protein